MNDELEKSGREPLRLTSAYSSWNLHGRTEQNTTALGRILFVETRFESGTRRMRGTNHQYVLSVSSRYYENVITIAQ